MLRRKDRKRRDANKIKRRDANIIKRDANKINGNRQGSEMNRKSGVTCSEVEKHLVLYLEGEADPTLAGKIKSHLDSCPSCREKLSAQSVLSRAVSEVLTTKVDPGYWDRLWPSIQARMAQRRQHRQKLTLRWVFAGAGAFAAAAAAFLFLILRPVPSHELNLHPPSYFADLPTRPPARVTTQEAENRFSTELADLSLGNAPPTQRALTWNRIKEL